MAAVDMPTFANIVGLSGPLMEPALIPEVIERLEAVYGVAKWRPTQDPVDELVACILSQHTSDVNSLRAFDDLKRRYPEWQSVIDAPTEELTTVIRRGGLANSKAPRIQAVLSRLNADHGRVSLDSLYTLNDIDARAYLMSLPGVGPKTAAIVLCFAMGRNVMPVDTHIFRVSWRLGLIEKRIGEAKAHDALQAMVPDELTYRYHVALITHGRRVCKAPIPRCGECILKDVCRWKANESRQLSSN